jgi:hypothetical protein
MLHIRSNSLLLRVVIHNEYAQRISDDFIASSFSTGEIGVSEMFRIGVLLLLAFNSIAANARPARDDGFYVITDSGPGVRTVNGKDIHLGEKFSEPGIRLSRLYSISNANERFFMFLEKEGVFSHANERIALCVADYCTTFDGSGSSGYGKTYSIDAWFTSRPAAEAYARFFSTKVKLRAHPGHMLLTRFVPAKDSFSVDDALPVTLEIQNVGMTTVTFQVGGQQRGARDNQFGFTAYGATAVPDTGDPGNLGGLSSNQTLKPGETFKVDVDLRKWFTFNTSGTYRITGSYQLTFYDPKDQTRFAIWQDYASAQFELVVK